MVARKSCQPKFLDSALKQGVLCSFCEPGPSVLDEMERAQAMGMGVINATPFNAGIGVTGASGEYY